MLIDITLTQWGQYNKYIEDDGGDTPGGSFTSKDDWDKNLIEVQDKMVSITRNCDENTAPGGAPAASAAVEAPAAAEAPAAGGSTAGFVTYKDLNGNVVFLKAKTGSGKTYAMLRGAIMHASEGGVAVIAFPNLNLLSENKLKLENLLKSKFKRWNISLKEISSSEMRSNTGANAPSVILTDLLKGRVIYLTLHNYIQQRGNYGDYSKFFKLLQGFRPITKIYIDEGHLYIDGFQKNLKITNLISSELNRFSPINSNKYLEEKILNNDQIYISPQMLFSQRRQFEGREVGYELTLRRDIVVGNNIPVICERDYNSIFKNLPWVYDKIERNTLQNPIPVDDIDRYMRAFVNSLNPDETFPIILNVNLDDGEKIALPHYRVYPVTITGDYDKDLKIKNFLNGHYLSIFFYNSYLTIMLSFIPLEFNKFFKKFMVKNKDNEPVPLEDLQSENVQLEIAEQLLYYNKKLIEQMGRDFKSADEETTVRCIKRVEDNLKYLAEAFARVFCRVQNTLEAIRPTTEEQALTVNLNFSKNAYLIAYNPVNKGSGRPEYDYDMYCKNLLQREKLSKELKLSDEELLALKTSDTPLTVKEIKNKLHEEIQNLSYSYQKETCFTSELVLFSMPEMLILSGFNTVYLLSATYSSAMISQLQNITNKLEFVQIKNTSQKLYKLVILKSQLDWFSKTNANSKRAWGDFVEFFKDNVWSDVDKYNNHKHGLLLAPTNEVAANFFKYNISTNKGLFSLVKGSEEKTSEAYKDPEVMDSATFVINPSEASKVFRVSSILSTVSVGLNMPEHVFIIAACNTYKPVSTVWKYGDIPLSDARNYETTMALLQAIGRNARRSTHELETLENPTRVVLISKADTYPNTIATLVDYSLNLYEHVEVCDMTSLELMLSNMFRSDTIKTAYNTGLIILKCHLVEIYDKLPKISNWEAIEDIRFNFIKEVLGVYKNPDLDVKSILERYINFTYTYRLYALCFYLCSMFSEFQQKVLETTAASGDVESLFSKESKTTASAIHSKLNYSRWPEYGDQKLNKNKKNKKNKNSPDDEQSGDELPDDHLSGDELSDGSSSGHESSDHHLLGSDGLKENHENVTVGSLNLIALVTNFVKTYNNLVTQKDAYLAEFSDNQPDEVFIKVFNKCFVEFFK